jgi:hypothetical protein
MRGLDPRIHRFFARRWIAGSSPAMTSNRFSPELALPSRRFIVPSRSLVAMRNCALRLRVERQLRGLRRSIKTPNSVSAEPAAGHRGLFKLGEKKQKQSATRKFVAEFSHCAFCGGVRPAITREHMPPKSLFDGSHRPDKLVMPACDECNRKTSTADLVAAIVSRWNYNSNEAELQDHRRLVGGVKKNHPDIFREWTSKMDYSERLKKRQHLEKHGVKVPDDAGLVTIGPRTIRQLNLFSYKAVLALYFEKFKKPLLDAGYVSAYWRTKEDFAKDGIPNELLEMMHLYGTLEQGKWTAREVFEYRFNISKDQGLFMCLARLRGGLFVCGFAANDAEVLQDDPNDWIKPSDLLTMLDDPRFEKRQ